ncbi:hypothetical protein [Mycoplasma sp. Mirounga ES2805-ORL]|uniref:hypothetical protein n=1 Tax=Mycoplasma sp. Mirounga ES2805-ORL TaxID=754514 RepID=UPI00197B9449|nr:hypothetical protein [Mycoplasma sp. Mirounga ES2805-ORL]QSF13406.1 hypothetical protein JXZ90_01880 [Mycoplasma sp. Mirounga ES2805-ORL]
MLEKYINFTEQAWTAIIPIIVVASIVLISIIIGIKNGVYAALYKLVLNIVLFALSIFIALKVYSGYNLEERLKFSLQNNHVVDFKSAGPGIIGIIALIVLILLYIAFGIVNIFINSILKKVIKRRVNSGKSVIIHRSLGGVTAAFSSIPLVVLGTNISALTTQNNVIIRANDAVLNSITDSRIKGLGRYMPAIVGTSLIADEFKKQDNNEILLASDAYKTIVDDSSFKMDLTIADTWITPEEYKDEKNWKKIKLIFNPNIKDPKITKSLKKLNEITLKFAETDESFDLYKEFFKVFISDVKKVEIQEKVASLIKEIEDKKKDKSWPSDVIENLTLEKITIDLSEITNLTFKKNTFSKEQTGEIKDIILKSVIGKNQKEINNELQIETLHELMKSDSEKGIEAKTDYILNKIINGLFL